MDQSGKRDRPKAVRSTGGKAPRKTISQKGPRWGPRPGTVEASTQTQVETVSTGGQTYGSTSDAQTQTKDGPTMVTTQSQTHLTVRNPNAFHD